MIWKRGCFSNFGVKTLKWKNKQPISCSLGKIMNPDTCSKLHLYSKLKTDIMHENYLQEVTNYHHRRSLTKFRIGAHSLTIETGRYSQARVPQNQRFCCNNGDIENEEHFLLVCKSFEEYRNKLMEIVLDECHNCDSLDLHHRVLFSA